MTQKSSSAPRAAILGLCILFAACGVQPQNAGEDSNLASRATGLPAPDSVTAVGGSVESAPVAAEPQPGTPEYDQAKLARVTASAEALPPRMMAREAPTLTLANSIITDPGCRARNLAANDDGSTGLITLPFSINYFGTTYNRFYINNNGNITFNAPMSTYTPFTISARTPPIIAPFFADVDTRNSGSALVTYSASPILFEGHPAFCINWVNVGYYNTHADKLNSFQLLLVERGDTGVNNFDIVMNYNAITWETGDASGGSGGFGGTSAGAGFSAGNGDPAAFFQFVGSLVHGGFLDSNALTGLSRTSHNSDVVGRHIFGVRSGVPVTDEHVALGPASASSAVGLPHTVTASLTNDFGQPLPGRAVTFQVLSGPNGGITSTGTSDGAGNASFTYLGNGGGGTDEIQATFVKTNGTTAVSNIALKVWTVNHPPVALCRNLNLAAGATCGVTGSINNGSSDPDGNLASCTQSPAGPYGLGTTHVTLTCTDTTGLSASCAADVTVADSTAPSIACPADATAECTDGSATVNPGHASAGDNCGSTVVSEPGPGSYPLGTTSVTHQATDPSGNSATCTNRVTVSDTRAPSVALLGNANPLLECNAASYVEAGATATDQCAGDVSSRVTISGSVNAGAVGTYALSYRASDPSGNLSAPAVRSITVRDTLAPSISCPAPQVAECVAGGALVAPGQALASDLCAMGSVSQHAPAVYPLGTTPITYAAVDQAGNASSCASAITVADTQAPAVALNGSQSVTLECGSGPYVDPGATASDVCAGSVAASSAGSVNTGAPGSYTIAYGAVDPSGNSAAPVTRTVNVQDTLAPALTVSASPGVLWPPDGELHPVALSAIASDSCDQNVAVSCTASSNQPAGEDPDIVWDHGNLSLRAVSAELGAGRVYTITCTAMDHSGHGTTKSIEVAVRGPAPLITLCNKDLYTHEPVTHVGAYVTPSADGAAILSAYFTVNGGAPISVTPRYPDGSLGTDITLQEGPNLIQLTATDSYGATTTETQTLVLDTVAPVISFVSPAEGDTLASTLVPTTLSVADQTPTRLTVQEVYSTDFATGSGTFSSTVDVVNAGYAMVWASATDAAGNTSEAWVNLFILDGDAVAGGSPGLVAPLHLGPLAKR